MTRKDGVIAVGIVVIVAGVMLSQAMRTTTCTEAMMRDGAALKRSSDEIAAIRALDTPALCAAWQRHIALLEISTRTASVCGPPQMTRGGAIVTPGADLAFYRNLHRGRCAG